MLEQNWYESSLGENILQGLTTYRKTYKNLSDERDQLREERNERKAQFFSFFNVNKFVIEHKTTWKSPTPNVLVVRLLSVPDGNKSPRNFFV